MPVISWILLVQSYDVVINATSASLSRRKPAFAGRPFAAGSLAYDMMYGKGETPFLQPGSRAGRGALRRRPGHAGRAGSGGLLRLAWRAPSHGPGAGRYAGQTGGMKTLGRWLKWSLAGHRRACSCSGRSGCWPGCCCGVGSIRAKPGSWKSAWPNCARRIRRPN